jgi:hypothetical protein
MWAFFASGVRFSGFGTHKSMNEALLIYLCFYAVRGEVSPGACDLLFAALVERPELMQYYRLELMLYRIARGEV